MREDHLCGQRARIKDGKKGAERSHLSTKQLVVGCFALWPIFANRSDPRQQSSNDTPAQPQSQAMGAARRDPRRGEIPVTRTSAVRQLPPTAREVVSNRADQIPDFKTRGGRFVETVLLSTEALYLTPHATRDVAIRAQKWEKIKACPSGKEVEIWEKKKQKNFM